MFDDGDSDHDDIEEESAERNPKRSKTVDSDQGSSGSKNMYTTTGKLKKTNTQWAKRRFTRRPEIRGRTALGFFHTDFQEIKEDPEEFFNYTRMTVDLFDELNRLVRPLMKSRQVRWTSLSSDHRLAITLQFLAQGVPLQFLASTFRIGHSTAHYVTVNMCEALIKALASYIRPPASESDWQEIAEGFESQYQVPNCLGSFASKLISVYSRGLTRHYYGIVLTASCDSNLRFNLFDVGENVDDAFYQTEIFERLVYNTINAPSPRKLPNSDQEFPYFFVGDEAFPLEKFLMTPYPTTLPRGRDQRIFDYRLSRARLASENALAILVARWNILATPLKSKPENVELTVMACVALHNFILAKKPDVYCPPGYADSVQGPGAWRSEVKELKSKEPLSGNFSSAESMVQRDNLLKYFLNEGQYAAQYEIQ